MYLTKLKISGMKLLRDLELSFVGEDGRPRMWTVIIGENGTCKTSILRAIAMASSGVEGVPRLVEDPKQYLDRRGGYDARVDADFLVTENISRYRRYPGYEHPPIGNVRVSSTVQLSNDARNRYSFASKYADVEPQHASPDPISEVREDDRHHWFVIGYGVERAYWPPSEAAPQFQRPSIDRLKPLFGVRDTIGMAAEALLWGDKARLFGDIWRSVVSGPEGLLPKVRGVELGDTENARVIHDELIQDIGGSPIRLPVRWLSHGYQSTLSWIADLVAHLVMQLEPGVDESTANMEGLVLIDEIDLYLHPSWQRHLIDALRRLLPRVQFVATTHSPLSLVGLRTDIDEIVVLRHDPATGDVYQADMKGGRAHEPDPRLMTGTEILKAYFGVEEVYPSEVGNNLRRYRSIASDPMRSDEDERQLDRLQVELELAGIQVRFPRAERPER